MGALAKRSDPGFWVNRESTQVLTLPEAPTRLTPETGVIERTRERDFVHAPAVIPISLILILKRFERPISYCLISLMGITLATVSAVATSASIVARDSRLNLNELKNNIGVMERQLEEVMKTSAGIEASLENVVLPIEYENVVWVPLPETR